jgi:16S rRNA G1207 methylase RsmC
MLAVETTQANIERNKLTNVVAVLSPGFRDAPAGPYNVIVSNLPAQAGNEAIDQILLDAYERLADDGSLIVVTVVGLKRYIKRRMQALFGNYHKAKQGPRHVVSEAYRPTRKHPTEAPPRP